MLCDISENLNSKILSLAYVPTISFWKIKLLYFSFLLYKEITRKQSSFFFFFGPEYTPQYWEIRFVPLSHLVFCLACVYYMQHCQIQRDKGNLRPPGLKIANVPTVYGAQLELVNAVYEAFARIMGFQTFFEFFLRLVNRAERAAGDTTENKNYLAVWYNSRARNVRIHFLLGVSTTDFLLPVRGRKLHFHFKKVICVFYKIAKMYGKRGVPNFVRVPSKNRCSKGETF
jgi:hypothetical protein